jgi:hypothetical protein
MKPTRRDLRICGSYIPALCCEASATGARRALFSGDTQRNVKESVLISVMLL